MLIVKFLFLAGAIQLSSVNDNMVVLVKEVVDELAVLRECHYSNGVVYMVNFYIDCPEVISQ